MNTGIRKMLLTEKPDVLVKEDLSFTKESCPKRRTAMKRRLDASCPRGAKARWTIVSNTFVIAWGFGRLMSTRHIPLSSVRIVEPALAKGTAHELTVCPNCGEMNANTAAAVNILRRADDKNITLYTPYKKVEKILEDRYANKQSVMA